MREGDHGKLGETADAGKNGDGGIRVTDLDGQRISFGRASGRLFAKILSGIIFCIGYMMAGWTARKQALHDLLANTLVLPR